jgi:GTP-binding protein
VNNILALLHRAAYRDSVHHLSQLPPDVGVEIAIAGRSNAGKSSLINRLCRQNGLAKTSRTPGRTRQLVFFQLDELRHLVDLPGYGYAKVSGDLKRHWHGLIQTYLDRRKALSGLVVVMDIRHPLKDSDVELIEWAGSRGLPLHLVLTKADKLGRGKQKEVLMKIRNMIDERVGVQLFSATSGQGLEELQAVMIEWLEGAQEPGVTESPGQ